MSKTGLRGFVESLFGRSRGGEPETRESLERAAGETPPEPQSLGKGPEPAGARQPEPDRTPRN